MLEPPQGHADVIRTCADNPSIFLPKDAVKEVPLLVSQACSLAGLHLKPSKCVIIPLCEFSEDLKHKIVKWLRENIEEWAEFSICPTAKLLGFFIGPKMGSRNWLDPISKFKSRVQDIKGFVSV